MVVLAASIISKSGKPLVSRQYMEMSRIRIEGLLAAFPKLVGIGKQHTYIETENVRYVYQPMEGLYLLLITNKGSNILEDLDTLRLLSKILPEFAPSLDEEAVDEVAFDLVFAFDEVISLGHKENITIAQVRQNCEMESHEEKLHKMIIQSKINDTKDVMKKRAIEIKKSKVDQKKSFMPSMSGFGSGPKSPSSMAAEMEPAPKYSRPEPPPPSKVSARGPSKGMQLGKAKKGANILESMAKEGEVVELEGPSTGSGPATTSIVNLSAEPVSLVVEEKLTVELNKEGGLEHLEVQGTMSLVVNNSEDAFISVALTAGTNKAFQFKTHPNIDKTTYSSSNILSLKDPSRPFPTGSELGILKWRMQSKDESLVPITINCWPSVSGGQSYVNIEYESTSAFDLQNIDGDWRFDSKRSALIWSIDLIDDTNRAGSMEFVVPATDSELFFPVEVGFTSTKTFCEMAVESVTNINREAPIKYGYKKGTCGCSPNF
eukprot:gene13531-19401_t